MGANDANISRNMFDERKRYRRGIVQVGVPWVDADENDSTESNLTYLRRIIQTSLGDGYVNGGFKVVECDDAANVRYNGNANNFVVSGQVLTDVVREQLTDGALAGGYFIEGLRCVLFGDVIYNADDPIPSGTDKPDLFSQLSIFPRVTDIIYDGGTNTTTIYDSAANYNATASAGLGELSGRTISFLNGEALGAIAIDHNTANTIVVPGDLSAQVSIYDHYRIDLSTPAGSRTDSVYLNSYLDQINATEDNNLYHALQTNVEAQIREQVVQEIFVREDSGTIGEFTVNGNDTITGLNQTNRTFTIAGDQVLNYNEGARLTVKGSTGNDGSFTVVSAIYYSGPVVTEVEVEESIPSATVDGTLYWGMEEVTVSGNVKYRYYDSDGNEHYVKKIAQLNRTATANITAGMIDNNFMIEFVGTGNNSPFVIVGSYDDYSAFPTNSGLPDAPDQYDYSGTNVMAIARSEQTGSDAITAVNTTSETFTVAGDQTGSYAIGNTFTVSGSTGNDGTWTIEDVALSGPNTDITVTGDITDSTADGTISFICKEGFYQINGSGKWEYSFSVEVETASNIGYSNTVSGLTSTNVQDAIDEIDSTVDALVIAESTPHDLNGVKHNGIAGNEHDVMVLDSSGLPVTSGVDYHNITVYDIIINRADYASDTLAGTALKDAIESASYSSIYVKSGTYEVPNDAQISQVSSQKIQGEEGTIIKWPATSVQGLITFVSPVWIKDVRLTAAAGGEIGAVTPANTGAIDLQTNSVLEGIVENVVVEKASLVSFYGGAEEAANVAFIKCSAINPSDSFASGFTKCTNLCGCYAENFYVGFFSCYRLSNCRAYSSGITGYGGFSACKVLSACESTGGYRGFINCFSLAACSVESCAGTAYTQCDYISGCFANDPTLNGFLSCEEISACRSFSSGEEGFFGCDRVAGCHSSFSGIADFYDCNCISACESASSLGIGFSNCDNITGCYANDATTQGFYQCNNLSGCKAHDCTHGFNFCNNVSASYSYSNTINGFFSCNQLSACDAWDNDNMGISGCERISACTASVNGVDGFNNTDYISASYSISNVSADWTFTGPKKDTGSCN